MARTKLADSGPMSDEGQRIQERRERLVMGRRELAEMAKVDRGTLTSIEEGGSYQAKTLTKILRALDDAEAEAGIGVTGAAPELGMIEIEVAGQGIRVVARGPIGDRAAVEESAARAFRNIQRDGS